MLRWFALTSMALGLLAAILGHVSEIRDGLFEILGPNHLLTIHFGMALLVGVTFLAAYLVLFVWIYRRHLARIEKAARRRTLVSATVLLVSGLAAGSIYAALPPKPDLERVMTSEAGKMRRELIELGKPEGGMRTNRIDNASMLQVWSSAQCLVAIMSSPDAMTDEEARQIRDHLDFINRSQLPGAEGWGYVHELRWGVTEVNAWVVLAELMSTRPDLIGRIWGNRSPEAISRLAHHVDDLSHRQTRGGGWAPINVTDKDEYARTYSTVMATWALVEVERRADLKLSSQKDAINGGIRWLLKYYDNDMESWVPNPIRQQQTESYVGLTTQTLYVIERARPLHFYLLDGNPTYERAQRHMADLMSDSRRRTTDPLSDRPVGRNDRTHDSDVYIGDRMLEGSTFLWFPWTAAYCSEMKEGRLTDPRIDSGCTLLAQRSNELIKHARAEPYAYVMAESLYAINVNLARVARRPPVSTQD
ncbi:hypothetical protein GCM10025759_11590 [Lysobacter panacisoli]|uniref:Uncharacterized protein n=1 Tax=Lysobacter panacisoli TaxID=1255263 RepID=A0ABP9LA55_9GAMM